MREHTRSQAVSLLEYITGIGLRVGVVIGAIALGSLIVAALGRSIQDLGALNAANRQAFVNWVETAIRMLTLSSAVVIVCLIIRLFSEEVLGQGLSFAGAAFYFVVPAALSFAIGADKIAGNTLLGRIVQEFRLVGMMCLAPGLVLLVRDAIVRMWTGISVRRGSTKRLEDERSSGSRTSWYQNCSEIASCSEFTRRECEAWHKKIACWRIKKGCYCDPRLHAAAAARKAAESGGPGAGVAQPTLHAPQLSAAQKRERCRNCLIYTEHQRQKYRILSPLVIPAVVVLMYVFWKDLYAWVFRGLEVTDKFMRVLTYRGSQGSFSSDGHILTVVALVWLGVMAVSYGLRALEYLIFEKQI